MWDDGGGFDDHVVPPTPLPGDTSLGIRVPGLVISPYANRCTVDHQQLSFDAYNTFIEDDFLNGQRLDPATDGRPDPRPVVRETAIPGDLSQDFTFTRTVFTDNTTALATPTPVPYGQVFPTPPPSWCSG